MKILCVILSLPENLKFDTILSVLNQTVPVDMIVLLAKKSDKPTLVERISDTLNAGLEHIKLADFDYILRLDGDTILGKDFIAKNLTGEPDVIGAGYAHLIKVKPFLEIMKGKYNPLCDDAYLAAKFRQYGKNVERRLKEEPISRGKHPFNVKYLVDRGRLMYLFGWTPVHVAASTLWDRGNIFAAGSYLISCLARPKKTDIADFVRNYQVRSEVRHFSKLFKRRSQGS
jgi:hypothetical protein